MSTLSSLYYNNSKSTDGKLETVIHVAEDLADGDIVIEIRGLPFDASVSRESIELRLPLKVWATIRAHTAPNERYLTITDEELRAEAEVWVKSRIDEFDPANPITGFRVPASPTWHPIRFRCRSSATSRTTPVSETVTVQW